MTRCRTAADSLIAIMNPSAKAYHRAASGHTTIRLSNLATPAEPSARAIRANATSAGAKTPIKRTGKARGPESIAAPTKKTQLMMKVSEKYRRSVIITRGCGNALQIDSEQPLEIPAQDRFLAGVIEERCLEHQVDGHGPVERNVRAVDDLPDAQLRHQVAKPLL